YSPSPVLTDREQVKTSGGRGGILLFGWSLISYTATRIINDPPKDMLENRCKKPPAGCLY
ncbi:hypothetical protein, partial [Klebsiella pneumoniae]|uniref:hypothetical protein n=1 Tax=Klebsiella pneumoniae TaxID=573 RepID=UPI002870B0B5